MQTEKEIKEYINKLFNSNHQSIVNHLTHLSFNEISKNINERVLKNRIKNIHEVYVNNKQLFKNLEKDGIYNILEDESLEKIYDNFIKHIEDSKVKKYAKSFLRSYKDLLNEESLKIFAELRNLNLDREIIANEIRKVAMFKDSKTLNKMLSNILSSYSNGIESIIAKINPDAESILDVNILKNKDNVLVLQINDFEASQELGSSQWCISTDESYFEEYLFSPDASIKYNGELDQESDEYDENKIEGKHFFYYNFNLPADNPLSKIGFTISANGSVVAAHNKNDECILEDIKEIISEEDLIYFTKKALPYLSDFNYDKLINEKRTYELSIENGAFLMLNTRNPLNVFSKIISDEEKSNWLLNNTGRIILRKEIVEKSYEDFFKYNEISSEDFIEDIFNYYKFVNYAKEELRYDKYIDSIHNQFEYDEDEEESFGVDMDITVYNRNLFNENFEEIFNNINDISKRLIFEKNIDILKSLLNEEIVKLEYSGFKNKGMNDPDFYINKLNNKFLISASSFLINKKIKLTNAEESFLLLGSVLYGKTSDQINTMLCDKIKEEKINVNILLKNIDKLESSTIIKLNDFINKNPIILESYEPDNKSFQELLKNKLFLEYFNNECKEVINKKLKENINIIYESINENKKNDYSFGIDLLHAKKIGILDNDILKRIDSSRISFGSQKELKKYIGEDKYKGFKESLLEENNKKIYKPKI